LVDTQILDLRFKVIAASYFWSFGSFAAIGRGRSTILRKKSKKNYQQ